MDVMDNDRLEDYSRPSPSNCWPFLVARLKSRSNLGSLWHAENQNATAGALCVTAVEHLLSLARTQLEERRITDSIAFSCTANSRVAQIWVHWREDGRDGCGASDDGDPAWFSSGELKLYDLHDRQHIMDLQKSLANIVAWGISERLPLTREALNSLAARALPIWLEEDREQRDGLSSLI